MAHFVHDGSCTKLETITMTINFETALGIHPQALAYREKRGEMLAANLANADTPGYKAKDMSFKAVLNQNLALNQPTELTQPKHIPLRQSFATHTQYRNPNQASLDGNTVEANVEQAKYAENAVQYEASLQFLTNKFSGLMLALRGQ
jgi:flagellar basal-body rod protein FlgB